MDDTIDSGVHIRGQQSTTDQLNLTCFLKIKCHWNTAIIMPLHVIRVCFHAMEKAISEFSICNRDHKS